MSEQPSAHKSKTVWWLGAFVLVLGLVLAYAMLIHPWYMTWGATQAEVSETLPGDKYMPQPVDVSTKAITIHAPASAVWPWVAQIGQGRAGWYTYTWLENFCFAGMRNADRILPDYQHTKVGDHIPFAHNGPYAVVAEIDPGEALVLDGGWTFVVRPIDDKTTRLIVRYASFNLGSPASVLFYDTIFEPAHLVMEAGMMMGIKQRAESQPS